MLKRKKQRSPLVALPLLALPFLLVASLLVATHSRASVEVEQLSSPELQARYQVLIEEMRCPKCQNQNLAGSDSMVATDLRREIRRLLEEGFSDQEVSDYMVARYGDFVLYRPPLQRNTLALWLAPGVFAALGLLSLVIVVARSRNGRGGIQGEATQELSVEEQQRLAQILDDGEQGGSKHND
ncbi:cytochrome c-type biogenesis protein CcmH [Microbulbifer bruguierae]|uniref:Cytochrome c-type biogenesis protein n=1 Tax=Microbulbifer bruguierae TaxID=3029061 RepID=A0ABY8NI71_9GAMM|nr:cytochrome c-type biogenesis protein CcmH [Microbulbifer bruguierae]WGL17417.1 cytochrome c-type biogenesis protein CcmH [Microbulbifer bruguierae]